jgi:predicted enzyme related to lactoylglutathione lyase
MQGRQLFRSAVASAALLTGVLTSRAALPALNHPSSTTSNPGKFEWADLFTGDLGTAEQFYIGLFGWTSSSATDPKSYRSGKDGERREYVVLSQDGVPVAGLVQRTGAVSKTDHPARWIGYLAVTDLAASLKAVTAAGGKVAAPEHRVPDRGKQAIIMDPEDAVVGLIQSSSGDLADGEGVSNRWHWFELFAQNPKTAGAFYQQAFNYHVAPDTRSDKADHYLLTMAGHNRAGIGALPFAEAKPDWLAIIRVDDIDATVAKVTSLGGEVVAAPQAAAMESRFAIVSDPTGGVFGLVQFVSTPASQ